MNDRREPTCAVTAVRGSVTRESVDTMRLQPGVMAYAVVKATNVVVELAAEAVASLEPPGASA